jgi:hypothetical protein
VTGRERAHEEDNIVWSEAEKSLVTESKGTGDLWWKEQSIVKKKKKEQRDSKGKDWEMLVFGIRTVFEHWHLAIILELLCVRQQVKQILHFL